MDRDLSLTYKEAVGWDFRDRVRTVETIADAPIHFRAEMIIIVNGSRRCCFGVDAAFGGRTIATRRTANKGIMLRRDYRTNEMQRTA